MFEEWGANPHNSTMKRTRALAFCLLLVAGGGLLQGCATAIIGGGGKGSERCEERDSRSGKCHTSLTQEAF